MPQKGKKVKRKYPMPASFPESSVPQPGTNKISRFLDMSKTLKGTPFSPDEKLGFIPDINHVAK